MLSVFNTFKIIKQILNFQNKNIKIFFCGKKVAYVYVKGMIFGENFVFFYEKEAMDQQKKVTISDVNFQIL